MQSKCSAAHPSLAKQQNIWWNTYSTQSCSLWRNSLPQICICPALIKQTLTQTQNRTTHLTLQTSPIRIKGLNRLHIQDVQFVIQFEREFTVILFVAVVVMFVRDAVSLLLSTPVWFTLDTDTASVPCYREAARSQFCGHFQQLLCCSFPPASTISDLVTSVKIFYTLLPTINNVLTLDLILKSALFILAALCQFNFV